MLYPDVPLSEWVEKYGLSCDPGPCEGCGKPFPPGRPAVMKGYAGLELTCPCGGPYSKGIVMTPNKADTKAFWKKVVGTL